MNYKRYRSLHFDHDAEYLRAHPHEIIEMDCHQLDDPEFYERALQEGFTLEERQFLDLLGPDENNYWYRVRYRDPFTKQTNANLTTLLRRD